MKRRSHQQCVRYNSPCSAVTQALGFKLYVHQSTRAVTLGYP